VAILMHKCPASQLIFASASQAGVPVVISNLVGTAVLGRRWSGRLGQPRAPLCGNRPRPVANGGLKPPAGMVGPEIAKSSVRASDEGPALINTARARKEVKEMAVKEMDNTTPTTVEGARVRPAARRSGYG
jgi:hypothetical protein